MTTTSIPHERLSDLRRRASSRLTGVPSAEGIPFAASDALAVLHDLASSPDTAADALALLHELQVHQVELELQAEELRESRAELESMLQRQITLYDHQPVGCFTIDRGLAIEELNLHAAGLLGVSRDEACGQRLDAFLSAGDGRRLRELLNGMAPGAGSALAPLQLLPRGAAGCEVRVHVAAEADGQRFLLVLALAA
jgi:PAS domain-containing protein